MKKPGPSKPLTKKQLQDRCKRLERDNRELRKRLLTMRLVAIESIGMARETLLMVEHSRDLPDPAWRM